MVEQNFTELSEECLYSMDAGCGEFSWEELWQKWLKAYQDTIQFWQDQYGRNMYG